MVHIYLKTQLQIFLNNYNYISKFYLLTYEKCFYSSVKEYKWE